MITSSCFAEMENDDADLGGFIEGPSWKEGEVILPPFPSAENLLKVDVDRGDLPFDFYLDSKNLSVSLKEGVTRYTVVIESESGTKNILFEGIRCEASEFRTYAYGTYDNKLVKAQISEWKLIRESDYMIHRYNFYRHYMCGGHNLQNSAAIIMRKVKYPEDFQESDERDD